MIDVDSPQAHQRASVGWNNDLQKQGLATLAKYGYHFGQDAGALFDYPFVDKLVSVLRPTTDAIVGPAIKFNATKLPSVASAASSAVAQRKQ